jgi:TetR/AcrR family transcriptional repressor of nem operon
LFSGTFMGRTSDARARLTGAIMEMIWVGSYGSASVEGICDQAGVKKGSFYYYFESKAALAEAALWEAWEERRVVLAAMLLGAEEGTWDGLRCWAREMVAWQREMAGRHGRVLGCPLHSLGAEISMQEEGLRRKVGEILERYRELVEAAVRRADPGVAPGEGSVRARRVFAYAEGLLTQARIANDLGVLGGLEEGVVAIAEPRPAAAVA